MWKGKGSFTVEVHSLNQPPGMNCSIDNSPQKIIIFLLGFVCVEPSKTGSMTTCSSDFPRNEATAEQFHDNDVKIHSPAGKQQFSHCYGQCITSMQSQQMLYCTHRHVLDKILSMEIAYMGANISTCKSSTRNQVQRWMNSLRSTPCMWLLPVWFRFEQLGLQFYGCQKIAITSCVFRFLPNLCFF